MAPAGSKRAIHPDLRLDVLAPAETLAKRTASSAAKRSTPDLKRLISSMRRLSDAQNLLMLPVLYENLDEVGIPNSAELETLTCPPSVERARLALAGLYLVAMSSVFPTDAAGELWPRTWAWVEFLHLYRDSIPADTSREMSDAEMYVQFSSIMKCFHDHSPTGKLIENQPGVQAFCTRTWMLVLDVPDNSRDSVFPRNPFMLILDGSISANFQEILDEAGGNLGSLAALVMKHLERVVPSRPAHFLFFTMAVTFLDQTNDNGGPFSTALLENGVFAALVKAANDLEGATFHPGIPGFRSGCLELIQRSPSTFPGYVWMAEALKAGLLRLLVQFGRLFASDRTIVAPLKGILSLLVRSMVYYPVICRMREYFPEVQALTSTPAFLRSPISSEWKNLATLLEARLKILKDFESGIYRTLKACDNLECLTDISPKSNFRRCSSCQSVYYCSTECQIVDWKDGGHRNTCQRVKSIRLREPAMTTRERAFLRLVMHRTYTGAQETVVIRQIQFMRKMPGTPFYTLFDLSQGPEVAILVQSGRTSPPGSNVQSHEWEALWKSSVERQGRSGGKMDMHVYIAGEGKGSRMRFMVMRSDNGALHEARRKLAADSTTSRADLLRELQGVVSQNIY
ncbi:hypothetical protein B0H11DRAFT_2236704 [Mycena galericulata]|nr:hypothetical protein B0H11DRAFT_2236704 [Mycena galericulata]